MDDDGAFTPRTSGHTPDDLLTAIASALADPDPTDFLALVSSIAHTFDARNDSPTPSEPSRPDIRTFTDLLLEAPTPETTALAAGLGALLPDDLLAAAARRQARANDIDLPRWLTGLSTARVTATSATLDALGDNENIYVSLELADGSPITVIVFVDHNLNSAARDGFVVPLGPPELRDLVHEASRADPFAPEIEVLEPADARARLEHAIDWGAMMVPPLETESWPQARPLAEWAMRKLPEGGTGYGAYEWTEAELEGLTRDFFASPEAAGLSGTDDAAIHSVLVSFATNYTGGDPLRWSPETVAMLLGDWFSRNVLAPAEFMERMPPVLHAYVRYCFRLRNLPEDLLAATLQAFAEHLPTYRSALEREEGEDMWSFDDALSSRYDRAARMVGGPQELEELTDEPLPAEDFMWAAIPRDIRPRVEAIRVLCDTCADELFDPEYRTAFRRVVNPPLKYLRLKRIHVPGHAGNGRRGHKLPTHP